jgi:chemotaxis protein CheY-P-specific phosphatase CheC
MAPCLISSPDSAEAHISAVREAIREMVGEILHSATCRVEEFCAQEPIRSSLCVSEEDFTRILDRVIPELEEAFLAAVKPPKRLRRHAEDDF